mgnify:CR=1 FL=1
MKNPKKTALPFKLYCDIFGHNYQTSRVITSHVKEYTCRCCKHQLTTDGNGKLTELTPKYQEINSILADLYAKRKERHQRRAAATSAMVA